MMKKWLLKMLGKDEPRKRKKLQFDIPYEQHSTQLINEVRVRPKSVAQSVVLTQKQEVGNILNSSQPEPYLQVKVPPCIKDAVFVREDGQEVELKHKSS